MASSARKSSVAAAAPRDEGQSWPIIVGGFLLLFLLTGGISTPERNVAIVQGAAALLLVILSIWQLWRKGFPSRLGVFGVALACAALLLVLAQLVPLPASVWSQLPGRDLVLKNFDVLGLQPGAMPLSLSPAATKGAAMALLPGIAVFLAALTLNRRQLLWPVAAICLCAVVSVALALLQKFDGANNRYYLYEPAYGVGTGLFNNRNFFAAQLYMSLPLIGCVFAALGAWTRLPRWLMIGFAYVCLLGLLVGIALSGSRTGLLLGLPAMLVALVLASPRDRQQGRSKAVLMLPVLMFGGILVMLLASSAGLTRLTASDPLADYRFVIFQQSLTILKQHWLFGTGFGSFVPVYQLSETAATMKSAFANHAHNDWLEVFLEGGLGAGVLMLCYVVWLLAGAVEIVRNRHKGLSQSWPMAALVGLMLVSVHSFVDFPLRTPAVFALFALLCGLLCLADENQTQPKASPKPGGPGADERFRSARGGFQRPKPSPLQ